MRFLTTVSAIVLLAAGGAAGQYSGLAGGPAAGAAQRESFAITRGKSISIDFPMDIRVAGTSSEQVAIVQMITPRRAQIVGIGYGQTDAQFFDTSGRLVMGADVTVEPDIRQLDQELSRLLPGAPVSARAVNGNILISGEVANAAEADRVVQMAAMFADTPEKVRNLLTITGNDEVTLHVQVVEVNRTVIKQLGFNTDFVFGQLGMDQYVLGNNPGYAVNGGFQGGFSGGYQRNTTRQPVIERDVEVPVTVYDAATGTYHTEFETRPYDFIDRNDLLATPQDSAGSTGTNQAQGLIQAFERQGLLRTLAEPNITAVSGQPARFLAGGEFAVPTGRDQSGNVTTEFKPYGVALGFTPVVLSGGRISIAMEVEVSELSTQGALTLIGTGGDNTSTIIPGLTVRRAESTIELPSGGSRMIAGLLMESTRQNIDKVPGLADLPILGSLARSRDYLNNETEIVIIVTAYLTTPTSRNRLQTPADGLRIASDMETILLGRLNSAYRAPAAPPETRTYEGPFGHVID